MTGDESAREMGAGTEGAGMASVGMGTDLAGEGGGTADDDLTDEPTEPGVGADESGLASGGLDTEEGAPT